MKKAYANNILNVNIAVTNMKDTIDCILEQLEMLKGKYFCFSNVHTTVIAHYDVEYCNVQNNAFMACPDGKPLSLVQRLRGYEDAEQVAGPDFMLNFIAATENKDVKHYFYGSTVETLHALEKNLRVKFPNIKIVGLESPPFRPLTEEEDQEVINRIHASGADVVWVGLGAPKQENWMYVHKDRLNAVMFGVGAAFDFHAGTIKRAPKWMREHYLEWLYRLFQDPKRLWKRYVTTNIQFIFLMFCDMFVWKKREERGKTRLLLLQQRYEDCSSERIPQWMKERYDITVISAVPNVNGKISRYYRKKQYYLESQENIKYIRIRVPEYREDYWISKVWNRYMYLFSSVMASIKVPNQGIIVVENAERKGDQLQGYVIQRLTKAQTVYDLPTISKVEDCL